MKARLLLPALAFLAGPLAAQDNDPPSRAGRVSSVAGTVAMQAAGTPDWAVAPLNYTVTTGDRLLTSQRSRAEIEVGPFDVRIGDSTDVTVSNLTDTFTQLGLRRGTLRVSVYRLPARDSMEVDTPNGAMIIRSAGRYRVDVLEGVSTIVSVEDGVVELSGPALDYTVKRGQTIELTGTSAINASMVPHPAVGEFDRWSDDRDSRQRQSDCSRYMNRDIPGCADLETHGVWEYQATYGYVWRPRIVTVGWVPYRHGRWVWTATWGYTWVEDSPWGYAPFHYGRWVVVGNSWFWAPGPIIRRPCYAPALVVFIGGSGYGRYHQAWFPLGWHEPYYPRYRHSDRYLREVNIANVRSISNVDEFVDPRRADRVNYTNRQAATVVSNDAFGRRQVEHEPGNARPAELASAPVLRDRWESTRIGSRTGEPVREADPVRASDPGRVSERVRDPVLVSDRERVSEPRSRDLGDGRERSPLIVRNAPPIGTRRADAESRGDAPTGTVRPRGSLLPTEPSSSAPSERGRPVIRRNPAPMSASENPAERPRGILQRGPEREVQRAPERDRSAPQRTGTSRPSAESAPRARAPEPSTSRGATRLPTRRSGNPPA